MSVKTLFLLFGTFFKISLFVVGGGLAMIPVIEETFVKKNKLLNEQDILDMVATTQVMPGLIAVNSAIFVGQRLSGTLGAVAATIGVILPSFIIMVIIASIFSSLGFSDIHVLKAFSCIRACICALFITMVLKLAKSFDSKIEYIIALILIAALFFNVSSVLIIVISIPIGYLYLYIKNAKAKEGK